MAVDPNQPADQLADALHANAALKSDLEACSSALQRAQEELEKSVDKARLTAEEMQHFIYAVGHDLRTPLRSVASYAKLLERQHEADPETRELTGFILAGAAEMNTLIEELLKYSRINDSTRRTTVSMSAIVQFALMGLQKEIQQTNTNVTMGELPELAVDESQFLQLFQQIIGNAIKFRSAAPPKIEVTSEENPGAYLFAVHDNGPGIEQKYQDVIFTPFKRLHGREVPGTGLGLAICKKIVGGHGGKIWVESDGQNGSTFKFTVPL